MGANKAIPICWLIFGKLNFQASRGARSQGVGFPAEEIKYLIFTFPRFGVVEKEVAYNWYITYIRSIKNKK